MYEQRSKPVISRRAFAHRLLGQFGVTLILIAVSLVFGVVGYHICEPGMSWIDALLNASMILGGMGEVTELHSDAGKLFASFYALYSGLFLIVCAGLLLSPVMHRILHRFHGNEK